MVKRSIMADDENSHCCSRRRRRIGDGSWLCLSHSPSPHPRRYSVRLPRPALVRSRRPISKGRLAMQEEPVLEESWLPVRGRQSAVLGLKEAVWVY